MPLCRLPKEESEASSIAIFQLEAAKLSLKPGDCKSFHSGLDSDPRVKLQ